MRSVSAWKRGPPANHAGDRGEVSLTHGPGRAYTSSRPTQGNRLVQADAVPRPCLANPSESRPAPRGKSMTGTPVASPQRRMMAACRPTHQPSKKASGSIRPRLSNSWNASAPLDLALRNLVTAFVSRFDQGLEPVGSLIASRLDVVVLPTRRPAASLDHVGGMSTARPPIADHRTSGGRRG